MMDGNIIECTNASTSYWSARFFNAPFMVKHEPSTCGPTLKI